MHDGGHPNIKEHLLKTLQKRNYSFVDVLFNNLLVNPYIEMDNAKIIL